MDDDEEAKEEGEDEREEDGFGEEDDDMEFGESQRGSIQSGVVAGMGSKRGSQRSS